jgi:hypothetical protein
LGFYEAVSNRAPQELTLMIQPDRAQVQRIHDDGDGKSESAIKTSPLERYAAVVKRLTSDLRISEAHAEPENPLLLRVNLTGPQIDAQRHADPGDVHHGVKAALGKDVD